MDILPAIDLREGKVVRLAQGDYARQTTYFDDPAQVATTFENLGAKWIHVVDLDAAKVRGKKGTGSDFLKSVPVPFLPGVNAQAFAEKGTDTDFRKSESVPFSANARAIETIRRAVDCGIELGGGARDDDALSRMFDLGADRIVIGSAALKNWAWFEGLLSRPAMAGKLALGLDARDGLLAAHGWTDLTELRADELAARVKGSGLGAIVYTDIARDGMLRGVNVEATASIVASTDVPVIASGGVGGLDDIRQCKKIGCGGVIVGRAYYEGRIDLSEALAIAGE
jgi:phosphoribosylformimino-5-aminoimidazole carboxamide ribotide isomerase